MLPDYHSISASRLSFHERFPIKPVPGRGSTSGAITCWGNNDVGQGAPSLSEAISVHAGSEAACGQRANGTVACWGAAEALVTTVPTDSFQQIAVGSRHACGILNTGALKCWGNNEYGASTPPL